MALDFGKGRRTSANRALWTAGALIVGVGLVAAGVMTFHKWQADNGADELLAAAWTVTGPPCPTITAAYYKTLGVEPIPFSFEGMSGERAHGDVKCQEIDYDGARKTKPFPVCEFQPPFALRISQPGGDVYFEPGVAKPATLSMPDGKLRCVLGPASVDMSQEPSL